ncbi:MAG: multicopper oxidase domain-containing protein, partial [Phycisphaerae bacterium]|nr:multicopper oxidase domain-containing protein [Gemmatimonadaceae bacterium]
RGDGVRDTAYSAEAASLAVTEVMPFGSTRSFSWVPERAGNWLFHCHIPEHFGARGPLGVKRDDLANGGAATHADHATGGMNGMVLGIEVRPSRLTAASTRASSRPAGNAVSSERVMRLLVRPNRGSSGSAPLYGYAFHETAAEPAADSGLGFGPTLDLVRGQPVRITIVNRLPEPTAVHWHGIELESYYDGVPGFSGTNRQLSPMIAPGDSFQVRFTPPRAGTFIYHTHAIEERQQLAGLAGAIVVNEAGVKRDEATDIPLLLSAPTDFAEQGRKALVNGSSTPRAQVMQTGKTYRLRLVQMSTSRALLRVELFRDSSHFAWRLVAKDGADLPPVARSMRPSRTALGIGETYDFEVTPTSVGSMRLEVRVGQPWPAPSVLLTTLPITVVPGPR